MDRPGQQPRRHAPRLLPTQRRRQRLTPRTVLVPLTCRTRAISATVGTDPDFIAADRNRDQSACVVPCERTFIRHTREPAARPGNLTTWVSRAFVGRSRVQTATRTGDNGPALNSPSNPIGIRTPVPLGPGPRHSMRGVIERTFGAGRSSIGLCLIRASNPAALVRFNAQFYPLTSARECPFIAGVVTQFVSHRVAFAARTHIPSKSSPPGRA